MAPKGYSPAEASLGTLVQGGGPVAFAAAAIRRTARASETPAHFFPTLPQRSLLVTFTANVTRATSRSSRVKTTL